MALQPRRVTIARYGRSGRTLERWEQDPDLAFPKATIIRGRKYDDPAALDAWDAACAARTREGRTPPRRKDASATSPAEQARPD